MFTVQGRYIHLWECPTVGGLGLVVGTPFLLLCVHHRGICNGKKHICQASCEM